MKINSFAQLNPNDFASDEKSTPKKPVQRNIIPLTDPNLAVNKGFQRQTPRFDPKKVLVFRLEDGYPTVDEARRLLRQECEERRSQGVQLIKVIHGYGSTGKGGALGRAMSEILTEFVNSGVISAFVLGQDFSCFNSTATDLIGKHPILKKDRDYGNQNRGISIIEIPN